MAIKIKDKPVYVTDDGEEHSDLEDAKRHELYLKVHDLVVKHTDQDLDCVNYTGVELIDFIVDNYGDLLNAFQTYESELPGSG